MFTYGGTERRSVQALSFVTYFMDFEYTGEADPEARLDFSDAAYGVMYSRPSFAAAIVWGKAEAGEGVGDLNVVDATATFWGNLVGSRPDASIRLGFPIVIHSGYRSVDPAFSSTTNRSFSYSSLGIGGGLTLASQISSHLWLDLRAWPVISMSFRSFEGFAGSTFLVDSDAQLHVVDLFGSAGLSLGYGFRYQSWNNDETGLPGGFLREDQFDYKGTQHMIRVGINW
jgi:hypothetical protein